MQILAYNTVYLCQICKKFRPPPAYFRGRIENPAEFRGRVGNFGPFWAGVTPPPKYTYEHNHNAIYTSKTCNEVYVINWSNLVSTLTQDIRCKLNENKGKSVNHYQLFNGYLSWEVLPLRQFYCDEGKRFLQPIFRFRALCAKSLQQCVQVSSMIHVEKCEIDR